MRLEYKGVLELGDAYRVHEDDDDPIDGAIHIDGTDIIADVDGVDWTANVEVSVNGEVLATGCLYREMGWGYSSWTPMDADVWSVDDVDIILKLESFAGQEVHLVVQDVDCHQPNQA